VGIAITCFTFPARRFLGEGGLGPRHPGFDADPGRRYSATDGIPLPCMVAVMVLFARGLSSGLRWYHVPVMGLALGLGLLAKGPVALLPVVVVIVTLWLIRKSEIPIGSHCGRLGGAAALGALLFVAWAIPANNATSGEFLRLGIGHHVLARAARPLESHGGRFLLNLPYYLPIIIAGFFPWTLHLPGSISAVLHRRVGGVHFRELFLAWVVSIVVIMTLVATKLPHYILFTWPAMALAVGGTLAAASQGKLADIDRNWLRGGIYFFGPVAGGMVVALLVAPFWLDLPWAIVSFGATAVVLAVVSVLAMRQQLQNRPQASAITLLAGMGILLLPTMLGVMPALENVKVSPALAQAVQQQTAADVPVAAFGYGEPTNFVDRRRAMADQEAVAVVGSRSRESSSSRRTPWLRLNAATVRWASRRLPRNGA
jgi:4-amino-4-deoxy-L-arabinose transferase-like glycosyltransferase